MAKVVVTGGAGFIGSHVVDAFLERGDTVTVIDDLSSGRRENVAAAARLHVADIRDAAAREVVRAATPDIVVHAAAQMSVRRSMDEPVFDTQVNVAGLVNILDALRGGTLPHVIFCSTGGAIYGEQERFPADEDHPLQPASVYGLAKRVGELYLDFWARSFGLTFTALRLGNVYGPRQSPHGEAGVVAIFCERMLRGEVPVINGTGEQTRDFVFVGDVVRAVVAAAERRIPGVFNIGTGRETSVNEVHHLLAEALGVPPERKTLVPAKAGEQLRSCISPARAAAVFGWRPELSAAAGLRATATWFREQHSR